MHESCQQFWIHFSISQKSTCYIKCLETWVKFCHNALKLISGGKNNKPSLSLLSDSKYNFGWLKKFLARGLKGYGTDAQWLDWGKAGSELRTENPSRAEGLGVPHGRGGTPQSVQQESAAQRTTRTPIPTNPRTTWQRGNNLRHEPAEIREELRKN